MGYDAGSMAHRDLPELMTPQDAKGEYPFLPACVDAGAAESIAAAGACPGCRSRCRATRSSPGPPGAVPGQAIRITASGGTVGSPPRHDTARPAVVSPLWRAGPAPAPDARPPPNPA